ncbi:Cytosolic copper metallochaperone [Malassezia brasiliensis]|uniref:Cytosolic copper metallochaperone n=1 Tax=Malassezia brasiliensis TaxID=1821822 RepID=A0AAF0IP63_9BASI|nr:Cytosolic copper metallochaperone [Malassezia brasiliensis]
MADEHHYRFHVKMACGACSAAIERVLSKLEGVSKYETALETQTVDVYTTQPYETVLEKIKKTGKEVISGNEVH